VERTLDRRWLIDTPLVGLILNKLLAVGAMLLLMWPGSLTDLAGVAVMAVLLIWLWLGRGRAAAAA
jgi:hypothetical protein